MLPLSTAGGGGRYSSVMAVVVEAVDRNCTTVLCDRSYTIAGGS